MLCGTLSGMRSLGMGGDRGKELGEIAWLMEEISLLVITDARYRLGGYLLYVPAASICIAT